MRPRSVALLAACIPLGLCNANDPAPRCAVDCASNIRNDKGALDLKVICADKLMTNSLFQCLITSCLHDAYSPAVAHVILACSDLGIAIGPLYPVEVRHANVEKVQDLFAPSMPAAYTTPSDPSSQDPDKLTLSFDISVDLKCNSGSDGLVTVSLPPPAPPSSTASPPLPPSPAPNPDPGEGEGDGQGDNGDDGNNNGDGDNGSGDNDGGDGDCPNGNGEGDNGSGDNDGGDGDCPNGNGEGDNGSGDNGNGDNANGDNGKGDNDNGNNSNGGDGSDEGDCENTNGDNGDGGDGDGASSLPSRLTLASTDPSATSSCPPNSASSGAQDPGNGPAPSPSTDGGDNGDPPATSAPSASPGGSDPASPASSPTPASLSSPAASASPAAPASPASTSPCPTASPATGGLDPQDPNQSDSSSDSAGEGEEPQVPATSPALPPAPASLTPAAPSSTCLTADNTSGSGGPVPGSQVSQSAELTSAAQPSPQPSPVPAPGPSPSDDATNPSSGGPPEYSSGSGFETSLPEPSGEQPPQESQGSGAQAPSYGQSGLTLRSLTSRPDNAAGETAEGKPPSKTPGPSEVTLWPTAKVNRTSHTTSAAGNHGSSTSSRESDGKETVTTAHTPRANLVFTSDIPRDASPVTDAHQHESLSSVTVKVVRSGETVAGTVLMTVLDKAPSATEAPTTAMTPTTAISNQSVVVSGSSNTSIQSGFPTTKSMSDSTPAQSGGAVMESSAPHVALVNSVPRATPRLFTIALLIILVGGMLLN